MDNQSHSRKLVTKQELAQRYGVCQRTIDNWTERGMLPCLKIGRKLVRFDAADCDLALSKFKTGAVE